MSVYLFLSILFNTVFASCYKVAAYRKCNLQAVNVWYYIASSAIMLIYVFARQDFAFHPHALALGMGAGAIAFFCTLSFFYHMQYGQLSASWTVISLAISFPILASIFIWHEQPSPKQIIGLILILVALGFFGRHEANGRKA